MRRTLPFIACAIEKTRQRKPLSHKVFSTITLMQKAKVSIPRLIPVHFHWFVCHWFISPASVTGYFQNVSPAFGHV